MSDSRQPLPEDNSRGERDRHQFSGTCQLVPINEKGELLLSKAVAIVGRDLSTTGLSFSHETPLSHKRAVVALCNSSGPRALEVEVVWSKRLGTGRYETDCRFVRNLTKPSLE
jgi:hypothetical protein